MGIKRNQAHRFFFRDIAQNLGHHRAGDAGVALAFDFKSHKVAVFGLANASTVYKENIAAFFVDGHKAAPAGICFKNGKPFGALFL